MHFSFFSNPYLVRWVHEFLRTMPALELASKFIFHFSLP